MDTTPVQLFIVTHTTRDILNNLAKIAPQINLQEGRVQKAAGPGYSRSMFGVATLPDAWPQSTPIRNFDTFLEALSLFDTPAIRFNPGHIVVSEGKRQVSHSQPSGLFQVTHQLADPAPGRAPIEDLSERNLPADNPAVEFTLDRSALARLVTTSRIFSALIAQSLVMEVNAADVMIHVGREASDVHAELTMTDVRRHDPAFTRSMVLPLSQMLLLADGDYKVSLATNWKYAVLENQSVSITYYIAECRKGQ
jgi:hypothetical protein